MHTTPHHLTTLHTPWLLFSTARWGAVQRSYWYGAVPVVCGALLARQPLVTPPSPLSALASPTPHPPVNPPGTFSGAHIRARSKRGARFLCNHSQPKASRLTASRRSRSSEWDPPQWLLQYKHHSAGEVHHPASTLGCVCLYGPAAHPSQPAQLCCS